MNQETRRSVVASLLSVVVGVAIAWAGSQHGRLVAGVPVFALCAVLAFAINWIVLAPAYLFQTERYFDLTGSFTYVALIAVALRATEAPSPRALLLAGLVVVWTVRLGSFLFARILCEGTDGRFDRLKPSATRFFMSWTLQGFWVLLTLSCALATITSVRSAPLGAIGGVGAVIFVLGFVIEVTADRQKRRFRANPKNFGRFIPSGLWAWSRHPNYFGEIVLWSGIALIALPGLSGWQHVTLISPVFVYLLLTRVSGIPLLETRATQKWGQDPDYCAYRERTPVLFPRPPRARR